MAERIKETPTCGLARDGDDHGHVKPFLRDLVAALTFT